MRLHVLTAVSRPENLGRVAESLAVASEAAPWIEEVVWHWRFDPERQHVGGQALKNAMLDEIEDGWIWCLDDDTLAHPEILVAFCSVITTRQRRDAVVFSQHRTDGRILTAHPDWVRLGFIDVGQAFVQRDWIGAKRIPETYEGDYYWLRDVLEGAQVTWLDEALSLHNAISGVDVGV